MKIIRIAFKFIKQNLQRPLGFVLLTLGPIVLMFILGQAFASIFYKAPDALNIRMVYYSAEQGVLYQSFREFLRGVESFAVTGEETKEEKAALQMIQEGKYQALVILDEKHKQLTLTVNDNSGIRAGIIEGMLNSFIDRLNFYSVLIRYVPETLTANSNFPQKNFITHTALNGTRQPRAIDYFGITILTMGMLFGSFIGAYGITRERSLRTLNRIYAAPVSRLEFLTGTSLGALVLLVLQASLVFLAGKYLMNIYYGEKILTVLTLLVVMGFFSLAMGTGMAGMFNDNKTSDALLNTLIPLFLFLGGGYMRLPDTPFFNVASRFSPVYWINKALFEAVYSTQQEFFFPAVGICLFIAGAMLLTAALKAVRSKTI